MDLYSWPESLIRNGNKTLYFLKANLAFINLFLCMLKLEPRKVPIFYYITVTSKSAILWTKERFIIHYKPRCMLFWFVLLFLGPKSGTKRGLTVVCNSYFLLHCYCWLEMSQEKWGINLLNQNLQKSAKSKMILLKDVLLISCV